jgi:hypothetical protein
MEDCLCATQATRHRGHRGLSLTHPTDDGCLVDAYLRLDLTEGLDVRSKTAGNIFGWFAEFSPLKD